MDDVIVVSEEEIVNAMQLIYERMKVVVEPSGAVGVAAVLSEAMADKYPPNSSSSSSSSSSINKVGIVLCGGNVDMQAVQFWENWNKRWKSWS